MTVVRLDHKSNMVVNFDKGVQFVCGHCGSRHSCKVVAKRRWLWRGQWRWCVCREEEVEVRKQTR
jgi:hypothetical protein